MQRQVVLLIPGFILISAILLQLRLKALNLAPIAFELPDLADLSKDSRLADVAIEKIGEGDLLYPEALVTCPDKSCAFASLGDGRVVRLDGDATWGQVKWSTVVRTGGKEVAGKEECGRGGPADDNNMEQRCGRPLGLWLSRSRASVDPNFSVGEDEEDEDVLLVADAYKGLLMATGIYGDSAEMHTLASKANTDQEGSSFSLLNGIVQTKNGDVFISETSQTFQRRRIFHVAMDGAPTGRLLRYKRGEGVEAVAVGLYMANGISISHDEQSLLIVGGVRILRYDIASGKMDPTPFVDVMPGTGDNIKAMNQLPDGTPMKCYWAALGGKYTKPFSLLKFVSDKPRLRAVLLALVPYRKIIDLIPKWTALAVYDDQGNLVETLRDDGDAVDASGKKMGVTAPWISEVEPLGEYFYLLSWYNPFLGRIRRSSVGKPALLKDT